jgi:two-component system uhpT operon response regulator UhpA
MTLGGIVHWIAEDAPDIEVTVTAKSWGELFANPSVPSKVDIVLLDIELGDNQPLTNKIITLRHMGMKVVVMSAYADTSVIAGALRAGALGYVSKSEAGHAMADAVRAAQAGETYLSDITRAEMAKYERGSQSPKLSAQERKVMALYGGGTMLQAIAHELGIGHETAKGYLKNIRAKYTGAGIDVSDKVLLRKQAIRDGIIPRDTALSTERTLAVQL